VANILFAWELGGGLGHLVQMAPLALDLAAAGHRVFAALRDLSAAHTVFGADGRVRLLQAPFQHGRAGPAFRPPITYAHILHNIGFADDDALRSLVAAWLHLYDYVRPDLIVFDHSPTALFAAHAVPSRRVVIGSGFCVPPDEFPMRNIRPWVKAPPEALVRDEQRLLGRVNRLLEGMRVAPLERLGQLYSRVDETFLLTFSELDHFEGRPERTRYWGPVNKTGGLAPDWPGGTGPKVYAYLKPFAALPRLLQFLSERGHPTLVYADGIDSAVRRRFAGPTLRFETRRLDLAQAAAQCDAAITNANHGTTATILMAGKPALLVPIVLEQGLMARRIRRLGAGLDASSKRPEVIVERLRQLLEDPRFADTARRAAAKFAAFDPARQRQEVAARTLEILNARRTFK
jgi:hypothetical protein